MNGEFAKRYGAWAVVCGASEGLGAQFALQLAERGVNVVLVARRAQVLAALAQDIAKTHDREVRTAAIDLADDDAAVRLKQATAGLEVGLLVYNAAVSVQGPFLESPLEDHLRELAVNCRRPLELVHAFGRPMLERGRGGVLLMASLAGAQGSPNIAHYGATKAWNRVFAEGLWGELRERGVDALACSAGATLTPGYLSERGGDAYQGSRGIPEMQPADVAREALAALGRTPSMIPGRANRLASFVLGRLLPRKTAVQVMSRASRQAGVE